MTDKSLDRDEMEHAVAAALWHEYRKQRGLNNPRIPGYFHHLASVAVSMCYENFDTMLLEVIRGRLEGLLDK
jgi:hypothetical protein